MKHVIERLPLQPLNYKHCRNIFSIFIKVGEEMFSRTGEEGRTFPVWRYGTTGS
jgi:hypothetical protein